MIIELKIEQEVKNLATTRGKLKERNDPVRMQNLVTIN